MSLAHTFMEANHMFYFSDDVVLPAGWAVAIIAIGFLFI